MEETIRILVGVFAGFVLGLLGTLIQGWWKGRARSRKVKVLIRMELDDNLEGLRDLDRRIRDEEAKELPIPGHYPSFLARVSLPVWSHTLWVSQLPDVAGALRLKALRATHEHHRDLDNLSEMIQAIRDNPAQMGYRNELYEKCRDLMRSLLARGNPVG